MPVSQLPQAPYRQDRKLFPTPLVGDVLFSEIRDCNRSEFPEYGTAHPNSVKWPHHKLVFIKPVDIERNEIFEFFYAADREDQDLYNFASGTKNIVGNVGGREFRIVQRVYVTLRTAFEPFDIPFGTAMPDIPAGQFDGVDYIFFEKQQAKIEQQELDSLYVAETHTYVESSLLGHKISYSTIKDDPIPEKFKVTIPQITTEEIVEGVAELPTLASGQLSESQDQLNPDVKLVKDVTRDTSTTATLENQNVTETLRAATTIESIVSNPVIITEEEKGYKTVELSVDDLGNGKSVKKITTVESWPDLLTREWDHTLRAYVERVDTFVDAATIPEVLSSADYVTYKQISEYKALKSTEVTPSNSLDNYLMSIPTRIDLRLPRVLKSIEIDWTTTLGGGSSSETSYVTGTRMSYGSEGGGSGSVAVKAEPIIEIEEVWGSDIPVLCYYFYIQTTDDLVDDSLVKSKLNALLGLAGGDALKDWPNFQPKSHTLILKGGSTSSKSSSSTQHQVTPPQPAYTQVGNQQIIIGYTRGKDEIVAQSSSSESTKTITTDAVTIQPTLHGIINVTGDGSNSASTSNTSVYRQQLGQRLRFSNDFSAVIGDTITLYPSGAVSQIIKNVYDATSFGGIRDGVYTDFFTNAVPVTKKIYFFDTAFNAVIGETITLSPSGHSFVVGEDVIDAVNNGVVASSWDTTPTPVEWDGTTGDISLDIDGDAVVAKLLEVQVPDSSVIISANGAALRYTFDANFFADTNDIVTLYPSRHAFTVSADIIDATDTNLGAVPVASILAYAASTSDDEVVVNETLTFNRTTSGSTFIIPENSVVNITTTGDPFIFVLRSDVTVPASGSFTMPVYVITSGDFPVAPDVLYSYTPPSGSEHLLAPDSEFTSSATRVTSSFLDATGTSVTTTLLENEPYFRATTTTSAPYGASGSVTPLTFAATSPDNIPRSGNYLVQSVVEPYKWDYVKCKAVVLDASYFQPAIP